MYDLRRELEIISKRMEHERKITKGATCCQIKLPKKRERIDFSEFNRTEMSLKYL